MDEKLNWKIHTTNLFKEIVDSNNHNIIFRQPIMIMAGILAEIANRAKELKDPKLNLLMCRLTLYEQADPDSKDYNRDVFNILEKEIKRREVELQ